MILSGKAEKAFPRGGVAKKKKSDNVVSSETSSKKFKENDDLFATKNEFVKNTNKKQISTDLKKAKKKGKKNEKKEEEEDDILTVKQVLSEFKLSCDSRFQRAFTACSCVFKVITLIGSNQGNFFENATTCSKRMLKTRVTTQLKTVDYTVLIECLMTCLCYHNDI